MDLVRIYENERVNRWKYETAEDLEFLMVNDYRRLFFTLIYFYLTERDLTSYNLKGNAKLLYPISLLCMSSKFKGMSEYYGKYVDVTEMPLQVGRMINEFRSSDDPKLQQIWLNEIAPPGSKIVDRDAIYREYKREQLNQIADELGEDELMRMLKEYGCDTIEEFLDYHMKYAKEQASRPKG